MFNDQNTFSEVLECPGVKEFLEKYAGQLLEAQTLGSLSGMTLSRIRDLMPEGMRPVLEAVIDVANGKTPAVTIRDPHTVPATIQTGMFSPTYNIDEVDGMLYMLDHALGGSVLVRFSKPMREDAGTVTYEGKPRSICFRHIGIMNGAQVLGVFVRDIFTEYGREYTLHAEGFIDEDGIMIDPCDIVIGTDPQQAPDPGYAANEEVALQAAREGIVLLKNNGALPLAENEIRVRGESEFRNSAVGAGKINPRYSVRLSKGLAQQGIRIREDADTALVIISRASGENFDNNALPGEFYLSREEEDEIARLRASCRKVIAVVNSGYPMDLRWTEQYKMDAVVWCGFAGMLGGQALAEVLCGRVNPSGKLPDTWSLDYWDIPASRNFYQPPTAEDALDADHDVWLDTCYEEDIYVGYRYFETFGAKCAYPFGFGLSYTDFAIRAQLENADLSAAETVTVSASVTNTGKYAGKEVVQVYAEIPDGKLEQPARRLIAFAKTKELAPGETQVLTLDIPVKRLESYDEASASWVMEAGNYVFHAGSSVQDTAKIGSLPLASLRVLKQTVNRCVPNIAFKRMSKLDGAFPTGEHSGIKEVHYLEPRTGRAHIEECNVPDVPEADDWTVEEMARLAVCANSGWGMHQKGEAGKIFRIRGRDLPCYAVADGNTGVNVNRRNIGFPSSNMVCASWNTELACRVGAVIADEAKDNEIRMILAPAMNIHRNPLCGRHPEYFSEDPLLAGLMAGNMCKGLEENGVDGSVKHVACNNSESSRKRNQTIASERALREIYFKAFEYALEVRKPASIMTGYNALNGVFTAEDEEMIQGIFREEFGFDGFVMTDWNSYDTADIPTSVQAGNCWFTPGTEDDTFTKIIEDGVKDGKIDVSRLRNNTRYILRIIRRMPR